LTVPPWPERDLLREACDEAFERKIAFAEQAEKDFALCRLLWAYGEEFGDQLLLKGGTCLSKIDLGFHRISEDADFVLATPEGDPQDNLAVPKLFADVIPRLRQAASNVGFDMEPGAGNQADGGRLRSWRLFYQSIYGPNGKGSIWLEVSVHRLLLQVRKAHLANVIKGEVAKDFGFAYCYALDGDEVRAEKVRAAFTRDEIRDFFDLSIFVAERLDMKSDDFEALVDRKLAEFPADPLRKQPRDFGKDKMRIARLTNSIATRLMPQLPPDSPQFSLETVIEAYNKMWEK
jgi:predicted nucleotidyltransferase component of viral defense system